MNNYLWNHQMTKKIYLQNNDRRKFCRQISEQLQITQKKCWLQNALCGLRQAEGLENWIENSVHWDSIGLILFHAYTTVKEQKTLKAIYVDDDITVSNSQQQSDKLKEELMKELEILVLCQLKYQLVIEVVKT